MIWPTEESKAAASHPLLSSHPAAPGGLGYGTEDAPVLKRCHKGREEMGKVHLESGLWISSPWVRVGVPFAA